MSHRSGDTSRHPSARDRRLLVLGIVLVVAGVGLSTCDPVDVLQDSSLAFEVRLATAPGGERE